jgi:hypothetical protein
MAELILSAAGASLGRAIVPQGLKAVGAMVGRTLGAYVGGRIDDAIFSEPSRIAGPRLSDLQIQTSSESAGVPLIYGRLRTTGQVIWAARFKEREETEDVGGGKGGPAATATRYRYSLSFAVGLCEGEISGIGRVWANGAPFDLGAVACRVHRGGPSQAPDPLIEAIEGLGSAPAYRDLAYVVFEDLPLEDFGNTVPQLSFEIVRPAPARGPRPRLEDLAKGVCLIPGAGEFAYATAQVKRVLGPGREASENSHGAAGTSNFTAAIEQLETDLPNCRSVMLVVGWFGDDLRCGTCAIRPCVEIAEKTTTPMVWRVAGVERATARVVSQIEGEPAYGGSPSDDSVIQAITALKARGFKVGLYPFLFMDIPPTNNLPDPYGGAAQAAFAWRGRITGSIAPGRPGTVDLTPAAGDQIAAFFGTAAASDFTVDWRGVTYSGPAEWSFRRFILHYAAIAEAAGGVDAFVIGSELKALTTLRAAPGIYPAVTALKALAAEARARLPGAKLTYAADWSEYFGHQPADGTGEVRYHLDPLWADANIDVVGVDWYPPLSDWRDGDNHLDAALARDAWDPDYLQGRIEAGEAYDWFYPDAAARSAQARAPITDGAHGEPWIYRAKDLRNWWANAHHDRPGGIRSPTPTPWQARSKPIWIVELGAPAVDKGANAPNLFIDPKSAESALPPFSSGARDDIIQRRTLEAYLRHWAPGGPGNPASPVYGDGMIDPDGVFLWAWDARPFPAFPGRADVWADSANWRRGHWLSGRTGLGDLADVATDLCRRAGLHAVDADALSGVVSGFAIEPPFTARAALEPLLAVHDAAGVESGGKLVFRNLGVGAATAITTNDLVTDEDAGRERVRSDAAEAPRETRLRYLDVERDWRVASISAMRRDAAGTGVLEAAAPLALDPDQAQNIVDRLHARLGAQRERMTISLSQAHLHVEPGDRIRLDADGVVVDYRVLEAREGRVRTLSLARDFGGGPPLLAAGAPSIEPVRTPAAALLLALDLPPMPGREDDGRPLAAVYADPWRGAELFAGETALALRPVGQALSRAAFGVLEWALYPGQVGRWDDAARVRVRLHHGALESVSSRAVLDGANAFAVLHPEGALEVLQARQAVLAGPGIYDLSGLLRGLQGTEDAAAEIAPAGSAIVRLDARLAPLALAPREVGATLVLRTAPLGRAAADPAASEISFAWRNRHARPFAPCRFRAARLVNGDVAFSWIRRARLGGDPWGPAEPPLGAEQEAYRLEILNAGAVVRAFEVATPGALYHLADQTADFAGPPALLAARVAQLAEAYGAGGFRESTFVL